MITVKEAQELREKELDLTNYVSGLEVGKHGDLSRSEKINITKQINHAKQSLQTIEEQLKDAPPRPLAPEDCWTRLCVEFNYKAKFEEENIKFLGKLQEQGVGYTLGWYAAEIIKAEHKAYQTAWFYKLEEIEDLAARLDKFFEIFPVVVEEYNKVIIQKARNRTSRSTSQMSNMVEDAQLEALTELYESFTQWEGYRINRIKGHFQSWKEIQS